MKLSDGIGRHTKAAIVVAASVSKIDKPGFPVKMVLCVSQPEATDDAILRGLNDAAL